MTFPANPVPASATPAPGAPPQIPCAAINEITCAATGTGGSPSPYQTQPNVFVGTQIGVNIMVFTGIPIDAPAMGGTRTIRITNIRANVFSLGASSGLLPVEISAIVSVNGQGALSITQPVHGMLVGVVQPDLQGSVTTGPALSQCQPHNATLLGGSGTAAFDFKIRAQEGYPAVFKVRNYGTVVYGNEFPQQLAEQNVPGFPYNTESGFYSPSLFAGITTPAPNIGLADFGTRILVQFENVTAGTHLFLPIGIATKNIECAPSANCVEGFLHLVKTGPAGSSAAGYSPVLATNNIEGYKVAEATYSGTTAYATYEVTNANPTVTEFATLPVAVAFDSAAVPAAGSATAQISFAPIPNAATGNAAPLPRFGNPASQLNAYTINSCPGAP